MCIHTQRDNEREREGGLHAAFNDMGVVTLIFELSKDCGIFHYPKFFDKIVSFVSLINEVGKTTCYVVP